ncbi:MAG: fatty acid hydroxylase, partial [Betaproteobacteria bacterium]|nr:fatty acid hydroxylase [Betaproteobacteria bacterium]
DLLFHSADFMTPTQPTGVRAQLPPPEGQGVDYGQGFWAQQWLGLLRMAARIRNARISARRSRPEVSGV